LVKNKRSGRRGGQHPPIKNEKEGGSTKRNCFETTTKVRIYHGERKRCSKQHCEGFKGQEKLPTREEKSIGKWIGKIHPKEDVQTTRDKHASKGKRPKKQAKRKQRGLEGNGVDEAFLPLEEAGNPPNQGIRGHGLMGAEKNGPLSKGD